MLEKKTPLKQEALKLHPTEIKAVKKGAKMYGISANHYKRGSIITQLKSDGLLPK